MYSAHDTLAGGLPHSDIHGSTPARGSPWLFAACHVLHRLLVPRHPPNALLILDIPARAVKPEPHHAQKPSSGRHIWSSNVTEGWSLEIYVFSAHNTIVPNGRFADHLHDHRRIHPIQSFTAPLNPRRRPLGCRSPARMVRIRAEKQQFPVRQVSRTTGPRPVQTD